MKKSRKIITLVSLILLIGLALTATFAWFHTYTKLEIQNNNDIICEASSSIKVSAKHSYDNAFPEFNNKIDLRNTDITVRDITGNGLELLAAKDLLNSGENELNGEYGDYRPTDFLPAKAVAANGEGEYIELNVKFSSKSQVDIYLDEESSVLPAGNGVSDHNPFAENGFSPDYISSAMRVAVIEKGVVKTIWAPNSQYIIEKKPQGNYVLGDVTGKDNGAINNLLEANQYYAAHPELRKPEQYNYFETQNDRIVNHKVTIDEYATKKFIFSSTKLQKDYPYILKKTPFSPILTTVTPPAKGQDGISEITLRIWFEGCDREANEALAGGKTKINLKFKAENSKQEFSEEYKSMITRIKYNPETSKFYDGTAGDQLSHLYNNTLYFSINGFDWYKYNEADTSPTSLSTFEKGLKAKPDVLGNTIYFKLQETQDNYEFLYKLDNLKYTGGAL